MRDAIEFPFDASKYAFRTNFDGLTASDDAMKKRVDDLATKYKTALENFESDDKDAREDHRKEKEDGCTEEFKDWVGVNYPQWDSSKADLSNIGTQLTHTASDTFGTAYNEKLKTEQSALNQAGWKEGYQPYFF